MNGLIDRLFRKAFGTEGVEDRNDAAVLEGAGRLAFTTDSFVVKPIFFPGGDIGSLAVHGTVNDLAMAGARPLALACAFILEEGFPLRDLERIVGSMRRTADGARVRIVTGDTKVVDAGKGDGVFVTTSGVGRVEAPAPLGPASVREGDAILVSGDLGRHGTAILAVREGLAFEAGIRSDCATLWPAVEALLAAGIEAHGLRDLTRGGLAAALNEYALDSGRVLRVEEASVPVSGPVRAALEVLGLDPLYVANEGRFAAFVPENQADAALRVLRDVPVAAGAVRVGRVGEKGGRVLLRTALGSERPLDRLSGEQLPRIC
jgi:hydrogenase expression/formation protein HypE